MEEIVTMTDSENTKDQLISGLEDGRMLVQYLDAVLMHLPVGVAILEGEDFRYFRINQALADINGLSIEEHLGKTVAEIIPDSAKILSSLRKVRDQRQASPERYFTIRLPHNPDSDVHLMDFHFPIVVDGVVKAIGAVVLDVTARKQREDELKKAYVELELREAKRRLVLEVLSDRELGVFEMTGSGLPTREIAERMHLSVKTVESYRARIKTKLNLESGTELMQHAVRWVEGESTG